jgi:hypothetical protein
MWLVPLFKNAVAQKDSLAIDDHGKYIYYKVVNQNANSGDIAYEHAQLFFKTVYDKSTLKLISHDDKNTSLVGEGGFLVSKKLSVAKHDDGRITCKIFVEIKEGKYRYWFTDFEFTPYDRDRYNNYVPVNSLVIDMEKAKKRYPDTDVDHYLDECAKFAQQIGNKLQQYIIGIPKAKADTGKKVIHIDKVF